LSTEGDGRSGAGCLFVISLAAGWVVGYLASKLNLDSPLVWAIGGAIGYAVFAGLSVAISESLWRWSHGSDPPKPWDREERAWVGAFWPITLPYHVVASLFFAVTRL
jgi:hypothetical protein